MADFKLQALVSISASYLSRRSFELDQMYVQLYVHL